MASTPTYKRAFLCLVMVSASSVSAFVSTSPQSHLVRSLPTLKMAKEEYEVTKSISSTRKAFLASIVTSSAALVATSFAEGAYADEDFESIAARAAKMAKTVEVEEQAAKQQKQMEFDPRSAYDFELPIAGNSIPFSELIRQEFTDVEVHGDAEGEVKVKREAKVKAVLVVNMKQDDPIARKNIPELISLASKCVFF